MFNQSSWLVMVTSSLACVITTIGVLAISRRGSWARQRAVYLMSFGAGVLFSVSFLQIIPKLTFNVMC